MDHPDDPNKQLRPKKVQTDPEAEAKKEAAQAAENEMLNKLRDFKVCAVWLLSVSSTWRGN